MEIEKFEKEFADLKSNSEIELSVLNVDDVGDQKDVKVIVKGKEIKHKVAFLICAEEKQN